MKFSICILASAAILLAASCKNSGYNKDKEDTTYTTSGTTENTGYSAVEMPATAKTNFDSRYQGATNVTWRRYNPNDNMPIEWEWSGWPDLDTSYYSGRFNWDGRDYWVWYDDQWNEVGSVQVISDPSTLPAGITGTINSKYPGYTISSAHRENDKDRNAYEIHLSKGDEKVKVLVDEKGNVMKTKTGGTIDTKEKPIKDSN